MDSPVSKISRIDAGSYYHYPEFRSRTGHVNRQKRKAHNLKQKINPDLEDLFAANSRHKKEEKEFEKALVGKEVSLAINILFIGVIILYLVTFYFIYQ